MTYFASHFIKRTAKCCLASLALFAASHVGAQTPLSSQWGFQPMLQPTSMVYSPDGTLLAVGGPSGVCLYSASTQMPYRGLATGVGNAVSIAFSPDGKSLALGGVTANSAGFLQVWSVSTGKLVASFKTAATAVSSVKFSPNGSTLLDGGVSTNSSTKVSTGVVEEWLVSTQAKIASLKTSVPNVGSVAFSPNGTKIAVVGSNGTNGDIEIWNSSSSTLQQTLGPVYATYLSSVIFSSSGVVIAVGGTSSTGALPQ